MAEIMIGPVTNCNGERTRGAGPVVAGLNLPQNPYGLGGCTREDEVRLPNVIVNRDACRF
jgi:hypothetical protein